MTLPYLFLKIFVDFLTSTLLRAQNTTLLSKVRWFFSNFVAFSENPKFNTLQNSKFVFCKKSPCSRIHYTVWNKFTKSGELKPKALIPGITENPSARNFFIRFSSENSIANICLCALKCSQLNFRYYHSFKINF